MTLQDNLNLAKRVTSEVRENVPNSANYAWTSSPVIGTQSLAPLSVVGQIGSAISSVYNLVAGGTGAQDPVGVHQGSNSTLAAIRSGLGGQEPDSHSGYRQDFLKIKAACYSAKLGNCGELSAIACVLLDEERRKAGQPFSIEYVQIWDKVTKNPALPHLVAVINRNPNQLVACSFPVDLPDRWHATAVICDPWDRVFYAAHDYDPYWAGLRDVSDAPQKLACKVICQI